MSKEYKIVQVSQQEPKIYEGKYGTTYYIKVKLEGINDPIEIGKKSPNALKVGDTVYGTITDTEYGKKFKAEKNPGNYSGGGKPTQDNTTMYVSYAKDLFVVMYTQDQGKINLELYEQYIKLIGLSGKALKQSVETEQKPSLKEQWDKVRSDKEDKRIPNEDIPVEAYEDINMETEINLDDIPFN